VVSTGTGGARYVDHVMGMPISLALRGLHASDAAARSAWAEVMDSLRAVDEVFSTYRPESVVSRLGRGELTPADCPPEVTEVIDLGEEAHRSSGGAFSVSRTRPDGGVLFDPSGVVKGWAAERAAAHLAALPDTDFCLSAGGDVTCRTLDPAASPWRIGIEDPHDAGRLVAVVPVHTGAVATSGTARRGAHIVDARSGRPPTGLASVTVIGAALTAVDVDATAAFALSPDAARWLRARGRTGLVVHAGGRTELVGAGA
jgi:thiamine biosynthesis lipoprotein